ncbi:MAG: hypothetical protein HQK77_16745 [Desulfobacterales bacterium]|nr:hypothetical protein [Desulfobacterales bacterium]
MTTEQDIVLIYVEDTPVSFARIEEILPDHKPNWYHVKFLMLKLPLEIMTLILRDEYIDGTPFTINGKPFRLERIVNPETENKKNSKTSQEHSNKQQNNSLSQKTAKGKVISFSDRLNKVNT